MDGKIVAAVKYEILKCAQIHFLSNGIGPQEAVIVMEAVLNDIRKQAYDDLIAGMIRKPDEGKEDEQ